MSKRGLRAPFCFVPCECSRRIAVYSAKTDYGNQAKGAVQQVKRNVNTVRPSNTYEAPARQEVKESRREQSSS